uniref:Peptidase M24 C-terminal domain-containing protein n=1 Tax=Populus alba TaxID=43335 RepID=A0A4U5QI26_POPAL|nr:hypothetical protein D5086_0000084780 [Populus alba]
MGSPQLKSQTDLQVTVCQMGSNVRALSNKEGDSFLIHATVDPSTEVRKSHIALGNACFLNGTNGHALDILARIPLWKDGLGLLIIDMALVMMNVPGSYEDRNFGIRLGNVLIVKEADTKFNFGDKGYLSFEHKTWAPYQTKMIGLTLLGPEVINWLNSYHGRCRDILPLIWMNLRWHG